MGDVSNNKKGWISLKFRSSDLEQGFREAYFEKSIGNFRIAFVIVILMYAFFGLLDKSVSGEQFRNFTLIRFYIVVPFLTAVLLFSLTRYFRKVWQELLFLSYVIAGSGIIYMVARIPDNLYYYTGLFLVFIAGFFFIRLRFLSATLAAILIIIFFNLYNYIIQGTIDLESLNFYLSNSFYVATVIIGAVASYQVETLERNEYYQKVRLIESQKEITDINENLEKKIVERTRELTKAKEKAEESDRLKSAFLTNMSHEIRTPMNGILGFTDLLNTPDITPQNLEKYIEIIKESSTRLLNTVNDIIDISKIETGQIEIKFEQIDMEKQINSLIEFFTPEAEEKGLELSFINKLEKQDNYLITDKYKFSSILSNLIKNGIKFTNKGWVNVTLFKKDDVLFCNVKDTGIGIPEDKQDIIFNRFEQAQIMDNRVYEGSGLGLSISKSYAKLLNGDLWVESVEGRGSNFFFQLPVKPVTFDEYKETVNLKNKPLTTEKLRPIDVETSILVAEDDEISAKHMKIMLKRVSHSVTVVSNGKEAVRYIENNPDTELILLDLKMPVMNGYEACQEILKIKPDAKIIAQTAFTSNHEEAKCMASGFKGYIAKPFFQKELVELIQRII
jgi:signal transduction histidine kinase